MSSDNEFQSSDAATGNDRRPTVVSRNGGTSSWRDEADRSVCVPLFVINFVFVMVCFLVTDA